MCACVGVDAPDDCENLEAFGFITRGYELSGKCCRERSGIYRNNLPFAGDDCISYEVKVIVRYAVNDDYSAALICKGVNLCGEGMLAVHEV